jgi:hypothetical protein
MLHALLLAHARQRRSSFGATGTVRARTAVKPCGTAVSYRYRYSCMAVLYDSTVPYRYYGRAWVEQLVLRTLVRGILAS